MSVAWAWESAGAARRAMVVRIALCVGDFMAGCVALRGAVMVAVVAVGLAWKKRERKVGGSRSHLGTKKGTHFLRPEPGT